MHFFEGQPDAAMSGSGALLVILGAIAFCALLHWFESWHRRRQDLRHHREIIDEAVVRTRNRQRDPSCLPPDWK